MMRKNKIRSPNHRLSLSEYNKIQNGFNVVSAKGIV
ncbi:hypothetical protein C8R34_10164 [Nitrosomonas sp. Nm84]|nr:hypothetical protein C8R34_10164 [Nitrosomonas sp. Nm84]